MTRSIPLSLSCPNPVRLAYVSLVQVVRLLLLLMMLLVLVLDLALKLVPMPELELELKLGFGPPERRAMEAEQALDIS